MTIATTLLTVDVDDGAMTRRAPPKTHGDRRALRYGENPHQEAYWQVIPEAMGRTWQVHQGKELSYTNLLDLDAAARIALEFSEPAAVVIKHTNPCGVATGDVARRCLRPRARGRSALGVRRHRRHQPRRSTWKPRGAHLDVHRGGDRAGGGGRGAGDSGGEGEPARGDGRLRRRWREPMRVRRLREGARFSAACSTRSAIASTEARDPWPRRRSAESRDEAAPTEPRVDGAALRVARVRARQVERGHLHRPPIARSPSAPGR